MVPIICILNHARISWVSIQIYYHDTLYLDIFSCFWPQFVLIFEFCVLTWSANSKKPLESRTMVCCSFVHLAWRTKDYKELVSRSWADLGSAWRPYLKGFRG